jgi:DNA polymerase-3 subunit gamma/tau
MPLSNDYRPKTLDDLAGNESTKKTLKILLERKDKPHVFLFHGEFGCGKTSLARIIKNMLGCSDEDYEELNIADIGGVDEARRIIAECNYLPMSGSVKVIVLDECHMASKNFYNAFLKITEEPPEHVYFILCTTEVNKILSTVRSRCKGAEFEVQKLKDPQMAELIRRILDAEKVSDFPLEGINKIVEIAEGHARDAVGLLDKTIDLETDKDVMDVLSDWHSDAKIFDLCQVIKNSKGKGWKTIAGVLNQLDEDPEKIRRYVLAFFSRELLSTEDSFCATVLNEFSKPFFDTGKPGLVLACYMANSLWL